MVHELKCWPAEFRALITETKKHEFRFNDRAYRDGDFLVICEWSPDTAEFTGNWAPFRVTYLSNNGFGLPDGFVIMSVAHAPGFETQVPNLLISSPVTRRVRPGCGDYSST
jgi:hypothetical protein